MTANDKQHGGTHYTALAIQTWDYIEANSIPYLEGSAIKYLTRWRSKGGIEDLKKAIHFIEKRIEIEEAKQGADDGSARSAPHAGVSSRVGRVARLPQKAKTGKVRKQQGASGTGKIRP